MLYFIKHEKEGKINSHILLKNVAFLGSKSISKYFCHGDFDLHKMITTTFANHIIPVLTNMPFLICNQSENTNLNTFPPLALSTLRFKIFLHLSLSSFSRLSDIVWFVPWRETEGCSSMRWEGEQNS
jgi:hypothetical protein